MNLEQELPTLLAKEAGLDKDVDPLQWWKNHSNDLPYWSTAAKKTYLCSHFQQLLKEVSCYFRMYLSPTKMLHLLAMSKHLYHFSTTEIID